MPDRREEIAKTYVPCRCDDIYTSRGLTAPDCPFHSTDPEMAMDEYFTERALELLEYVGRNVKWSIEADGGILFWNGKEYLTAQKLFENFL